MGLSLAFKMATITGGQAAPTPMKQFEVVGHRTGGRVGASATVDNGVERTYRMHIFAPNETVAKSRFWYFLSQFKKLKKANGEILSCKQIFEKNAHTVKNFGIWVRYDSRTLTHNMYKEYRDVTLAGAVSQMYQELASGRFRSSRPLRLPPRMSSASRSGSSLTPSSSSRSATRCSVPQSASTVCRSRPPSLRHGRFAILRPKTCPSGSSTAYPDLSLRQEVAIAEN